MVLEMSLQAVQNVNVGNFIGGIFEEFNLAHQQDHPVLQMFQLTQEDEDEDDVVYETLANDDDDD